MKNLLGKLRVRAGWISTFLNCKFHLYLLQNCVLLHECVTCIYNVGTKQKQKQEILADEDQSVVLKVFADDLRDDLDFPTAARVCMYVCMYRISLYKGPGVYFLPATFDPALKRGRRLNGAGA